MKKLNFVLATALTIGSVCSAYAESTSVYCGKIDDGQRYMLTNDSGAQEIVSGQRGSAQMSGGATFDYFSIQESVYNQLKSQCRNGFIPFPYDEGGNHLYFFWVERSDGRSYLNILNP